MCQTNISKKIYIQLNRQRAFPCSEQYYIASPSDFFIVIAMSKGMV